MKNLRLYSSTTIFLVVDQDDRVIMDFWVPGTERFRYHNGLCVVVFDNPVKMNINGRKFMCSKDTMEEIFEWIAETYMVEML